MPECLFSFVIADRIGDIFKSGSEPGRRMVLSAPDKSTLMAPELRLNSTGLEARFFMILIGSLAWFGKVLLRWS